MILSKDYIKEKKDRKFIAKKADKNIFIEAGAGAGKSTSLIDRIYHLMSNGVPAKNIYAITFTNKATEELRSKIVKYLKNYKNCDDATIATKKELLKTVDDIHISTIHKFCEDILKENAVKAGLSPDFKIVKEQEEKDIYRRIIRKYFRQFNHWAEFKEYEDVLFINNKDAKKEIRNTIVALFYSMLCTVDRIKSFDDIYQPKLTSAVTPAQIRQAYADFFKELDSYCTINTMNGATLPLSIKPVITNAGYVNGQSQKDRNKVIDNLIAQKQNTIASFKGSPFDGNKGPKALREQVVNKFKPLLDKMSELYALYNIQFMELCLKYTYEVYKEYCDDRDNETDELTNNDMIYRTYTLLCTDKDVLNKVRIKVRQLFIDEYQDTDSVQYKIASLIAENKPDCLYIVGDPKQSIYRFRGAEPDVFFETKRQFDADPSNHLIYDLNINFRSNSKIIEWVNNRYSKIGLIDPNLKYVYKPMMNNPENDIPLIEYNNQKNLIGFYKYNKCSPSNVKDLIFWLKDNMLVRKEKHVEIKDDDEEEEYFPQPNEYRNIEFNDIMVLLENHASMPEFVEVFTQNNIPARVYGESRFSNTLAVRSFINLYSGILLKNKSGFAQAESVFRILQKDLYVDKTIDEAKEITKELLNELKERTNKMDAYGKAIYLVEHLSLLLKENHKYEGFEMNFAESKIYQMIEEVFSKGYFNGNELIQEFTEYYQKVIERESLIQKDLKAVTIINLHKAKGLEAPIVIWVSTVTRNKFGSNISDAYKDGVLYAGKMCDAAKKSVAYNSGVINLKADEEFENARKEYVAVTRPQEAFIFVDDKKGFVSMFHNKERDYAIFDSEDVRFLPIPEPEVEEDAPVEVELEEKTDTPKEEEIIIPTNPELEENATEDVTECDDVKHKYRKASTGVKATSPSSLEEGSSNTRDQLRKTAGELPPSNRPKSKDVGTILHRALQLLIKDNLKPEDAVNIAISECSNLVPTDGKDEFVIFFNTCVRSFKDWFNSNGYELYTEFGFSYYDGEMINNGSIDLLMVKDDEYIIVDYKSDEAEYILDDETFEITLREKYEPQLNAYEKVIKDIFGSNKIKKKIIYFRRYDPSNQKIDVKSMDL